MPSKGIRIRIPPHTYGIVRELAGKWNVTIGKVIDMAVRHMLVCNRVGISPDSPYIPPALMRLDRPDIAEDVKPPETNASSLPSASLQDPAWWHAVGDTLWVLDAVREALLHLADIYPDLRADWLHLPYEVARRLDIVLRDWGFTQGTGESEQQGKEGESEGGKDLVQHMDTGKEKEQLSF